MPQAKRIAAGAALCGALALGGSAAAGAAPHNNGSKATLSKSEYQHLVAEVVAIKKFFHSRPSSWNPAYAACGKAGASTPLLQSIRTGCNAGIGLDVSLTNFYADFARCSALNTPTTTGTTTTTTGTTTTGTGTTTTGTGTTTTGTGTTGGLSATTLQLIACLNPEYQVIRRSSAALYQSAIGVRSHVLARGFTGLCRRTLAPTPDELTLYRHFASTSRQLAADVNVLTKVADGSAPSSDVNVKQINTDGAAFDRAARVLLTYRRPQKLSVCPHQ
jgi:hypothetical protein